MKFIQVFDLCIPVDRRTPAWGARALVAAVIAEVALALVAMSLAR